MATHDLNPDLQGNEPIIKAVEYLRMLPEWKDKPAKLKTGHVEFAQLLARYLVNLYCTLEGKTLTEKIDLDHALDPLAEDREATRQANNQDMGLQSYKAQLDEWHLEISMAIDALRFVAGQVDDDRLSSVTHLAERRADDLLSTLPYPSLG